MAHRKSLVWALLASSFIHRTAVAEDEYYNQFSVCADSLIVVEELLMTCDSPGSYYYGGNQYRNSATCVGGDKGKLQLVFDIVEDLEVAPYISLNVEAYGSVPEKVLYTQEDLCSLSSLSSLDGAACPAAGQYMISEKFYFEDQSDDSYEYNFKPVPSIGFLSDPDGRNFDLGGANTDYCAGGMFQNWSANLQNTLSNTLKFFMVTLGIFLAASFAFVAWRYCVWRRDSLLQQTSRSKEQRASAFQVMHDDLMDEEDLRRIAMLAREKDLIDA